MEHILQLVFNLVAVYALGVPVAVVVFWIVDRTIEPKNILPVPVMWWAAWRWPITISQIIVALSIRMYIYYKMQK